MTTPKTTLKLEALEDRMALAANLTSWGTLAVSGTDYDDQISVRYENGKVVVSEFAQQAVQYYDPVLVEVVMMTVTRWQARNEFDAALVKQVSLDGGKGNDRITNSTAIDARISGGRGNDTLQGGSGRDEIWGEAGWDTLDGGDKNDLLIGGEDVDILNGGTGDDVLVGGMASGP